MAERICPSVSTSMGSDTRTRAHSRSSRARDVVKLEKTKRSRSRGSMASIVASTRAISAPSSGAPPPVVLRSAKVQAAGDGVATSAYAPAGTVLPPMVTSRLNAIVACGLSPERQGAP